MYTILVICIIIVIVVLALSLITTSKAYDYKHTIDPLEDEHSSLNTIEETTDDKGAEHGK
jgi:uncharacterized protein YpmB